MWPSSRSLWSPGSRPGSIALIGFGVDSLIEVLAGGVVVWLFTGSRIGSHDAERRAQQAISISFELLAAYVTVEALRTLAAGHHPDASWVGISLAAFTAVTMPLLARAKRRVGHALGSSAAVSEAKQTTLCAYLSVARLGRAWSERGFRPLVGRSRGRACDCWPRRLRGHPELARRSLLRRLLLSAVPEVRSAAKTGSSKPVGFKVPGRDAGARWLGFAGRRKERATCPMRTTAAPASGRGGRDRPARR